MLAVLLVVVVVDLCLAWLCFCSPTATSTAATRQPRERSQLTSAAISSRVSQTGGGSGVALRPGISGRYRSGCTGRHTHPLESRDLGG